MRQAIPKRVVIERVTPMVDGGRFPTKAVVGDPLTVEADVFADGHDLVVAVLRYGPDLADSPDESSPMQSLGNDRFRGRVPVKTVGRMHFDIYAWIDEFTTWAEALRKRMDAGQDVAIELLIGSKMAQEAALRAPEPQRSRLREVARGLTGPGGPALAADEEVRSLVRRHPDPDGVTSLAQPVPVVVDRERAVFGAWYELFPRSLGAPMRHGTFKDLQAHLPQIAKMGFDVVYLPPIHPIGRTGRKGRNNTLPAAPTDPGSPWAIGASEGGHMAVHPELGSLEDFRQMLREAARLQLEIALDLALQCSPDHPWVSEHPTWFLRRPDGTIRYAENPPKRYEDIYPLDFESPDWQELWQALLDVTLFWSNQGVRIFRVDNPHTKPFAFWEWLIRKVKDVYPETVFLAEAFTRPKVMYRLAKLGFSQSYTYFTWRNESQELQDYLEEITSEPVCHFFRPNLWPNTPDILSAALRQGGRAMFAVRLLLAATLGASYGIYGPAYEQLEHQGLENGTEEYLRSEKYEIRTFAAQGGKDLIPLVCRVNAIRREHPALRRNAVRFHRTDNPACLAYSKRSSDGRDTLLVIVNLDPSHTQAGFTDLDLADLGIPWDAPYTVTDLLDGSRYTWSGPRNYVELPPDLRPGHIFRVEPQT